MPISVRLTDIGICIFQKIREELGMKNRSDETNDQFKIKSGMKNQSQ